MRAASAGAWRAPALAALGGVAAALAFPPYGVLPGVFGYALILHAWSLPSPSGRERRAAFLRGWAAGTGYLSVCTSWIVEPFLVDVAAHGWQAPFAVLGCSAGIGLLWGGAGLAFHTLRPAAAWRAVVFAAVLALAEWVRGHLLTGFPWDLPGETWRAGSPLSQGAAMVGAYGLTPLTVFVGAAPAILLQRTASVRTRTAVLTAAVALVAVVGVGGAWRLAHPPTVASLRLTLRVVQPDLPEPPAWSPQVQARALNLYTALTAAPAARPADLVVWPEGAIPASFNELYGPGAPAAAQVAQALAPGQVLLTGGYRVEGTSAADARYFNSLIALRREADGGLRLAAPPYDKHHLVPFGEYLPLARIVGALGLRAFVGLPSDFTPGPRPTPLTVGAATLQPLICYEALFPALAAPARGGPVRARLLVNVSDDAWFGRWAGPWRHLNLASYRAIEEGLPMVRATPTGVSAVIDGLGRPAGGVLPPGRRGVLDAAAPAELAPTAYARWRDAPFALFEGCVLLSAMLRPRRLREGDMSSRGH